MKNSRNLQNSFFVKNYNLNLIFFFQVMKSALLKNERKKDARHPKIAWSNKGQGENIKKTERKTKNERTTEIDIFLLLLFYVEKIILYWKIYFENFSYIMTFVLQFFL